MDVLAQTAADPERFGAGGRYRVLAPLGAGAFGVVHRVYDERWGQELALKTIQDVSPELRQWLKAEYRSLRDIVHPNLVRLHELHVDGEHCFFTMDIVTAGEPFTQRLAYDRHGPEAEQQAAIRRICRAALQLADALQTVHRFGKCHRDIKPNNVLVTPSDQVVLLDFGLAGAMDRDRSLDTARGAVMGTLPYLAPEQYLEPRALPASDWYSVGLVLYEALVGELPFSGDATGELRAKQRPPRPPSTVVPAIPKALDDLLVGLLDPDFRRRPSPAELIAVLKEYSDESEPLTAWRQVDSEQLFVAREDELATLFAANAAAEAGRFVAVEVIGSSGMGKTALIREFLGRLAARSDAAPLVLEARCNPHESIPYKAFDAAIDDLTRYWVGLDPEAALALCPDEGVEALTLLFPELRRVPVLAARSGDSAPRGDPRTLRNSGFQALQRVLARLGARQSVVLWIDDLQWADADSVALVEGVFGGGEVPPLHMVLSRRPDDAATDPALLAAIARAQRQGLAFRVDLAPLAEEAALALARGITMRSGVDVASIVAEAAGVPYLVAELAHFATGRGDQHGEPQVGMTAGSLMNERLRGLAPEDRVLVELAALCGAAQSPTILLEAAHSRDRSRLRDLCVLRLLRWAGAGDGEALQIYHDRLREFVVGALSPEAAIRHHQALVVAMEATSTSDAEQMTAHALAAGDRPRTRRHAITAARRAEAALAFDLAARLYRTAIEHNEVDAPRAELHALCAEALANAGQSTGAAPEFERAAAAIAAESPAELDRRGFLRRRAGEQYLKAGHFEDGLRLMEAFLADADVRLPRSGTGALAVSAMRRVRLYLGGFEFQQRPPAAISSRVRGRLEDLWAATTALSMMDPVRADGVGLLHFLESLRAGDAAHVARSLGYEAAFAALIGGPMLRGKARELLRRNMEALAGPHATPYEHAFYQLGAGSSAFFHSEWDEAARLCDAAARGFRTECRGAEYEAAVAVVFGLQARGQAGQVAELVARIPAAIRDADARGDLFAANNYRGGFHSLARIAAGQIAEVQADLRKVVETWKPGFYQMHAYHRVFTGVAVDLYTGDPRSAVARIEQDWPELKAGLFLRMELPAMELRWTRARAALALAAQQTGRARQALLGQVRALMRSIARATTAAAGSHAALLAAGLDVVEGRRGMVTVRLRAALSGYTAANMAMHREVVRWCLAQRLDGEEARVMHAEVDAWMRREGVPAMAPLADALAPGLGEGVSRG